MRRVVLVLLVATLLLAVAVVVLAPAALIAPELERASQGRLSVGELEGTLWHGRGVLAAASAHLPFAWTLDAMPLLTGEVHVHVTPHDADSPSPRADITTAKRRLALSDVAVTAPAVMVQQAFARTPGRAAWSIDGEITATTPRFEWTPAAYDGGVRVVWRAAHLTIVSEPAIDLGEATATLAAQGNRLAGPVANAGGNLDVHGDVAFGTDGSATVSLLLTPRSDDDAELARLLGAVGTPEGAGWRVKWNTPPR